MAIKREEILVTVLFDEEEIYSGSAATAISGHLSNEDGVIQWTYEVTKEEDVSDQELIDLLYDGPETPEEDL